MSIPRSIRLKLHDFWAIACAFVLVGLAPGCGGADPPGVDHPGHLGGAASGGPGVGQATPPKDAGQTFRDPDAGDAGCVAPNNVCAGACVAVSSDPDHCGSCDVKCVGPTATCLGGQCACGPGYDYCQGAGTGCMDVSTDVNNCGSCGHVCDPNQFNACAAGQCVAQ